MAMTHPLRLLTTAYTAAAAAGALLFALGAGPVIALLMVWIGGALAALALPMVPGIGHAFRHGDSDRTAAAAARAQEEAALGAALMAWEADRAVDTAPPRDQRDSAAG